MASAYAGGPSSGAGPVSPVGSARGSATNPKMRKRTKTGCLTCRKRRIKCGEERPTCNNCVKSKRQCEGYNQRVIFKPPMGDWPGHPGSMSTMQFHSSTLPTVHSGYRSDEQSPQSPDLPRSATHHHTHFDFTHVQTPAHLNTQHPGYLNDSSYHRQPVQSPQTQLPTPTSAASYYSGAQPSPATVAFPVSYAQSPISSYDTHRRYSQAGPYQQASYDTQVDAKPAISQAQSMYQHTQSATTTAGEGYPQYARAEYSQGGQYSTYPAHSHAHSFSQSPQIPQHDVTRPDVKFMPQHVPALEPAAVANPAVAVSAPAPAPDEPQPELLLNGFGGEDDVSPTQVLDEAAVECEDDDYYDVQSDEEMADEPDDCDGDSRVAERDFSLIQRMHRESTDDHEIRRYDSFIYEGILVHYQPEQVANPLKNPKTARVFMHFLHVTGPTLSVYERNPRNPSSMYEGPVPPPSHQSLWTYTLPMQALNNQGLLHAMLALSSLHIAKLQKASVTPSWKHYAYAMKRLVRALGNPKKRLTIATLATSLLLAFYEVTTAEHTKWSTHVGGAAQLLADLDFRSLTQEARRLRAAQTAQEKMFPYQNPDMLIDQKQFEQDLRRSATMPDANLVSTIVGKHVDYDDFGRVFEEGSNGRRGPPEKFDLQNFETLQDLYWWYCRQDMMQSIISGNPLIMDYSRWSDCPPRGPIGRIDLLVGSHDHIILLMGRIADFIVRDRERKIKQVEADGGQWRPRPGMPGMGPMGPPQGGQGQGNKGATPTTHMGPPPHMQGMGPPPGWSGPPPPGWTGGPPPGWTGGPPPGWQGAPRPSTGPQNQSPNFTDGPNQGQPSMPQQPQGPPPTQGPGFYGMTPSQGPVPIPSSYTNYNHPNAPRQPQPSSSNTTSRQKTTFPDLPAAYAAALEEWHSLSAAHATLASALSSTPTFSPLTTDLYPTTHPTPFGPALLHGSYAISAIWLLLHLSQILLLRSHPACPPAAIMAASVVARATEPYANLIGRIAAGFPMPPQEAGDANPLTPAIGAAHIDSAVALFFAGVQVQDGTQRAWLVERLLEVDRRTGWASAGVIARSCETCWERAGEAGKGPPYRRRTKRFGEGVGRDERLERSEEERRRAGRRDVENLLSTPHDRLAAARRVAEEEERLAGGGAEMAGGNEMGREGGVDARSGEWSDKERRYVVRNRAAFPPWAMNLLADEEDLRIGLGRVDLDGEGEQAGGGARQ